LLLLLLLIIMLIPKLYRMHWQSMYQHLMK